MAKVWCGDEETFFGQLITLTNESIVLAYPDDKQVESIRSRLQAGESAASVLHKNATVIPFLSIIRISTDRHDEDIEIEFETGGEKHSKTLRLLNPEKRDEVYAELKTVFGQKFEEIEDSYSLPRAAIGSLLSLTICGGLTWVCASAAATLRAADDYEIEGRHASSKALIAWILETLGPIGVSIIGGILCLLSGAMLYLRVRQPQSMLIMQEEPYRPESQFRLIGKYLVLFFMWYVAARAAV